eukprot:8400936-Alexandrium_andersonii.AAC.1
MTATLRSGALEGSGELRKAPESSGELQSAPESSGEPPESLRKTVLGSPLVIRLGDHRITGQPV